ncbi:polymorphic toxin type 15 domain-containing protein, partial [Streptococcus dentapri]
VRTPDSSSVQPEVPHVSHQTDGSGLEAGAVSGAKGSSVPRAKVGDVEAPARAGEVSGSARELPKASPKMDTPEGKAGEVAGVTSAVDDVPRIDKVEVEFNRNPKHDEVEFSRQLADQEKGMNELTVQEYLDNREKYIAEGRALEGDAAQKAAREDAFETKYKELRDSGLSRSEAQAQAQAWLDTQAALHNPDQIAGGNPLNIGGMGDKAINSSIGSQWKYRIDAVDEQIQAMAAKMTPDQLQNTYLNVKLTY